MNAISRLLAAVAIAVFHFACALTFGPTQAFLCIALGECVEDPRRPQPEPGVLDWPVSALSGRASEVFAGASFPMYALVNALAVAMIAWLLLSTVAWLRLMAARHSH